MNNSVFVVSHRTRVPFGFECDDEPFSVIHVFSTYAKAFKYIQTKHPDIYKGSYGMFENKDRTSLYKIEKVELD